MVRPKSSLRLEWVDPAVCSLDYRLKIIGRLPFFKHLPTDAISRINGLFHDHDVHAGARIYFEGDEATHLYMVAMGKVKLIRSATSGHEVLLDILRGANTLALSRRWEVVSIWKLPSHKRIVAFCKYQPMILIASFLSTQM